MTDDEAAELESMRQEMEERVRAKTFMRQTYTAEDMLIAREPNEAGYYASHPYHGGPFNAARFRLVRGGWDHDHCFICAATIKPGDEWWAASPPDEVGLCLACHERLFGSPRG
jgi:hypothetical protein